MDPASFAAGLTVGILATCAGSTLIVWRLIHRAPLVPDPVRGIPIDPAHLTGDITEPAERDRVARIIDQLPDGSMTIDVGWIRTDDPAPRRWLGPDEITFERGPVTYYPPHTPPLTDLEAIEHPDGSTTHIARGQAGPFDPICTCGHPESWHNWGNGWMCRSPDPDDTCVRFVPIATEDPDA